MRRRALECFALVAFVALVGGKLSAQPKVGVALDYQAHAGCPGAEELLREIVARTPRAKLAEPGEDALWLRVRIDEVPGGSHGELVIGRASDGSAARRELSAADCRQVVSALALMTALVIDPDAATSPEPPRPPPAEPPRPTPVPPKPSPKPPAPSRAEPPRFRIHAGLGIELSNTVTPELRPGALGFGELTRIERGLGYEARLSFIYARHTLEADAGAGSLALTRGRLDACLRHPVVAPPLWIAGCGAFEAGALAASGRDVTPTASETRPWFAGGPSARLEVIPTRHLRLEVGGNVLFPFVRDRFFLYENATLRETPPVTFGLAAALSAAF